MSSKERLARFRSVQFASRAAFSLLHNDPNSFLEANRSVYEKMAKINQEGVINQEEIIYPEFLQIAQERNLFGVKQTSKTYWSPNTRYNPFEVFGTMIQFLGQHNASLPRTVLPPEGDVRKYINMVMETEGKVDVAKQFNYLLDITDNNIVGAANLGFIASRLMARGDDARAYSGIPIAEQDMLDWNDKIAQFKTFDNSGRNDGPGDTYYFWTHFFAALFYKNHSGRSGAIFDRSFEHGTQVMKFVKNKISGKTIITDHYEASQLGRNIGLAFAEYLT